MMSPFLRVMIAVGALAFLAGVLALWRQHERPDTARRPFSETPGLGKVVGSSTLSHGGPAVTPVSPFDDTAPFHPGQRVTLIVDPPVETANDRFAAPRSVPSGLGVAARRSGTEVVVTNVETRPASDGRVEQFFEVRFPDGRSAWVRKDVLRVPAPGDDLAYQER